MRYAIFIEKAEGNYSAYVPDLPGCGATGETVAEVESQIREAIAFHHGVNEWDRSMYDGYTPTTNHLDRLAR